MNQGSKPGDEPKMPAGYVQPLKDMFREVLAEPPAPEQVQLAEQLARSIGKRGRAVSGDMAGSLPSPSDKSEPRQG